MCGCDKKPQFGMPKFRQIMAKDRLGRVVIVKVPIQQKRRPILPKKLIANIQPKIVEEKSQIKIEDQLQNEVDAILPK